MCAPFLIACLYPANSSQFRDGSAQVIPPLPHQCCRPAILVVGFDGGGCLCVGAATEDPDWLATRASGATTITADRAAFSERLIPNPFVGADADRIPVIRLPLRPCKTQSGTHPIFESARLRLIRRRLESKQAEFNELAGPCWTGRDSAGIRSCWHYVRGPIPGGVPLRLRDARSMGRTGP